MAPISSIEIKKDNAEVVSTSADKNAEAKVLATSLHDEKIIEADVAVNKEKGKVSLLGVNSINNGITDTDANNFEKSIDKKDEKKSWTEKAGDWVRDHKKMLGRGLTIGAGVLLFRYFNKKKKEKEEVNGNGSHENKKKSFRESGWGKALKYTMIGGGIYYGVHGLSTGRWDFANLFNWNERNQSNPEDLKSRYEKEVPAELKLKYEDFGNMVDSYQVTTGSSETLGKLKNEKNEDIIIPTGCIPAAMDDAYDNVGDILDTENYINDKRRDLGGKLRDKVTGLGSQVAGKLFRPFVGVIKGLTANMFGANNEPNEEFKKWAEQEDLNRDEQVANLMSKYAMIRVFLGDKKKQLENKYASDYLRTQGNNNPTQQDIADALENENVKDYVQGKLSNEFMKKKIASLKDESGIVSTLKKEGVYDNSVSEQTSALVDNVKERKSEVIGNNSIFEQAKNSTDINKDEVLKKDLMGISDRFGNYLKKGFLQRNMFESMANCFGILNLDQLRNGKQEDIEEVMESLGFNDAVKRFQVANTDFKAKLIDGTLTKEDVSNFEKNINEYFNKEQEILLESQRKNDDESISWSNVWTWTKGRAYKLVSTPQGWIIMGSVYAYGKFGVVRTTVNTTGKVLMWPLKKVTGLTVNKMVRNMNIPIGNVNVWTKLKVYSTDVKSYNTLMQDVASGKIDATVAEKVFDYRAKAWGTEVGEFHQKLASKLNITDDQAKLLKKYLNGDLRQLAKDSKFNFGKLCVKLKDFESKVITVSAEKEALMINLINNGKFKNIDDIDVIIRKIDTIDISLLSPEQIKEFTKELSKDISVLNDTNKIDILIRNIKAGRMAPVVDEIHNVERKTFGEGLTGNKQVLFERTGQEIDALTAEAESLISKDKKVARAVAEESKRLKDFAKEIKTLNPSEAGEVLKILGRTNGLRLSLRTFVYLGDNAKDIKVIMSEIHANSVAGTLTEDVLKGILAKDNVLMETLQKAGKLDEVVVECMRFGKSIKSLKAITTGIEILAKFLKTVR